MKLARLSILPTAAILTFSALTLTAKEEKTEPLGVGDKLPEVTIQNADGDPFKLQDTIKSNPAVIIFYRGGWCPFCTKHLMALGKIHQDLNKAGLKLFAISPDQPQKVAETPDRDELKYTLLSDPDMTAAKAFGIAFTVDPDTITRYRTKHDIDLEEASGRSHHMLPHPSVFIVDRRGIIQFAHSDPNYKTRLDGDKILEAARKIK